jgi:hypothetical protein
MASGKRHGVWQRLLRETAGPAVIAGLCLGVAGCGGGGSSGRGYSDAGTGGTTGTGTVPPGDPCNGTVDCTPGSICWNEICIGEGSLRFSLAWTVASDFDLHVQTPAGTEIYYGNSSAEGASLDVDDCVGNSCRNPEGTHVENIFWADVAASGTYLVWVENYNGGAAGDFTIEVGGASAGPFTGSLSATSGESSEQFSVTY